MMEFTKVQRRHQRKVEKRWKEEAEKEAERKKFDSHRGADSKIDRMEEAEGVAILAAQEAKRKKDAPLDSATQSYMAWGKAIEDGKFDTQKYAEEMEKFADGTRGQEKPWWKKTLDWIDNHQPESSIGLGAIVGLIAIGVTLAVVGAVTLPVLAVAAGVAAVAAGVTVAAGTVGLNAYYGRPPTANIWSNVKAAAITAAAVTGVGLFVAGGLLTQSVIAVGNALGGICAANPAVCANAGAALNVADQLEEVALHVQLGIETATHNPHAIETALELQLEQVDGGAPGNTVAAELGEQIAKFGDDVPKLIDKYGDDAKRYLDNIADIDLANLNLEQGYVVSKLAQEFDIPITITGRWADTPAEAARRGQAADEWKILVSQGIDPDLAKVQIGQKYGIDPYQVKVSSNKPEIDVFIPKDAWDALSPEQQVKIRQQLIQTFNVKNRPDFEVDFYQELPLDKIAIGWPDPRTNVPPGSISFHSDGKIIHTPFATP